MEQITEILSHYQPISLEEMDAVKLLNRIDSKYVMSKATFERLLPQLTQHYQALEIEGKRSANYNSLYFDSKDFKFYLDHHNGRVNRHKVRIRKYVDSNLCFFEIKHKIKGRTDKKRILIDDFTFPFDEKMASFMKNIIPNVPLLSDLIYNSFERVTLVNNERKERLTFDIGLNFNWKGEDFGFDKIVIAEVKQEVNDRHTPGRLLFKKNQIREAKVSKYCIGMGMLYNELKTNRFKSKYLLIDKIQNQ